MDAGALDKLHDARHEHIRPVADSVDLQFLADDVLVNEHRLVFIDGNGGAQVFEQRLVVGDNLHRAPAEHIARSDEHGVSDLVRGLDAVLDVGDAHALRARCAEFRRQLFKVLAVFRLVERGYAGADDLDTALFQRGSQVDGRLPAERGDDAHRVFQPDDVHDVLRRQRLEIELVARGVVGRDGFRVVVDDDRVIAGFLNRHDGVYGGIVEFHALPDADRAGAEYDDLRVGAYDGFVFVFIGRIEVRHIARELARTGVDHLIDREQAEPVAHRKDLLLRLPP